MGPHRLDKFGAVTGVFVGMGILSQFPFCFSFVTAVQLLRLIVYRTTGYTFLVAERSLPVVW